MKHAPVLRPITREVIARVAMSTAVGAAMVVAFLAPACAWADAIPVRSAADPRVRWVDYKADDVFTIAVALGVVTRIILASDEQITKPPDSGFPAGCEESANEWCIRADVGQNQITIKPRRGATKNNLEVSTNKRDYSFSLVKMDGAENAAAVYYRVVFRYAMPPFPAMHVQLAAVVEDAEAKARESEERLAKAQEQAKSKAASAYPVHAVRNVRYSFRAEGSALDLLPSLVFDDGRFTYLKFPKAREVPAVFATDASGEEIRIALHPERLLEDPQAPQDAVESDYLVVHRLSRKLHLRLGTSVAEIINDHFDAEGVETHNGTTQPGLVRESLQ